MWIVRVRRKLTIRSHEDWSSRMMLPALMHGNFLKCINGDPSSLFRTAAGFKATDPRDKVYALIAFESLKFNPLCKIRVDYGLTTAQVYFQATASCILQTSSLCMLQIIQHDDPDWDEAFSMPGRSLVVSEFASWIPQFSDDYRSLLFIWGEHWNAQRGLSTASDKADSDILKLQVRGTEPSRDGDNEDLSPCPRANRDVLAIRVPDDFNLKPLTVRGILVDVATSGGMPLSHTA
jgi:hypothetical protein